MKIEEVSGYLKDIYIATNQEIFYPGKKPLPINGNSILLLGAPGIGKTTGVGEASKKIAELLKREPLVYNDSLYGQIVADPSKYFLYTELNLNDVEPAELTGIPKEVNEGISYKQFLWALALSRPEAAGILCLDEFTNIQRLDVITASYKVVLDHLVGFTKLSPNVMVVATGNSPKESSVANLLPAPLVDRFTISSVACPTVEGWTAWMDRHFGDEWDKRTLAYLNHWPEELLNLPNEAETLENFPTPRSWTKVSLLLPRLSESRWSETTVGSLGPATGDKFIALLNTRIPNIEELLARPSIFQGLNLDAKYLASVLAGSDLRNRFLRQTEEKKRQEEIEKTLPLLRTIKESQQEFIILAIISGGDAKIDIALALARKDRGIGQILEGISVLRANLEVGG